MIAMTRRWSISCIYHPCERTARALRCASLLACVSLALAAPAPADVVKLRNGERIKCKVVKEMNDLVKVRMPHRGKIVTTFLHKGAIESISKSTDVENRKLFQSGGVHNPGRTYEPVYYTGSGSGPAAASGPAGARAAAGKGGKTKAGATAKKRGVDARRERSDARSKERGDRFGKRSSRGLQKEGTISSPSAPAAPATSESSGTTIGGSSMTIGQ